MDKKDLFIIFLVALILAGSYIYALDSIKFNKKSDIIDNFELVKSLQGKVYAEQSRASEFYTILWFLNSNTPKNISMNITNSSISNGMRIVIGGEFYDDNKSIYDYKLDGSNITISLLSRFPEERKISYKDNNESVSLVRLLIYNYTYNVHKISEGYEIDSITFSVNYDDRFSNGNRLRGILGDENDISNYLLEDSEKIKESVIVLYER